MHYFSIDYLIVGAFLLITLYIGLRAGRGVKDMREYVLANKTFGTGALVLTLLATNIAGACVINDSAQIFSEGIIMTLALLGVASSFLLTALFIAPKVAAFDSCMTMGDLMRHFYGAYSGILAGILGLVNAVLLAGMELAVLGIICTSLLGIRADLGTAVGGGILAAYVAYGGIKSVTITDVLQFVVLAIFIPLVAYVAVSHIGGIAAVFSQVPTERLTVVNHPRFSFYLTLFLMWIIPAGMIDPAIIQRMLMAKYGSQLRNQYFVMAAFDPAFRLLIMLIALAGLVLYPTIEAQSVVPRIIHELLPVGIKGMTMAGVLAVCMSTIDSYMHAAGFTLVHDIVHPICKQKNFKLNELKWVRYATMSISLAAIGIGLYATDILGLLLLSLDFTAPLLMFPLFAGIMGLKTDRCSFYIALWVTLGAFGMAKLLLPTEMSHFSILISMAANGLTFFGAHLVQHKGFAVVSQSQEVLWRPSETSSCLSTPTKYFFTPQRLIQYSQTRVTKYGAPYILFGLFCCINYILPYFMWPYQIPPLAKDLMLWIRLSGAMCCALLIVKEKWPRSLLPYLPTFWHLTLLYCLPFTSTVMFLLTQGSVEWLINIAVTIMFLIVLVDWVSFLILTTLGISLGFLFYRLAIGTISLQLDFTTEYLLVYQGLFATLIGLLFARRKQQRVDKEYKKLVNKDAANQTSLLQTAEERFKALKTLQSTGVQKLLQVAKDLQGLHVEKGDVSKLHTIEATLIPMAFQLQGIDTRAQDHLRLQVASVPIKQWLTKVQEALRDHGIEQSIRYQQTTQHKELVCDPERLTTLLTTSIAALRQQGQGHQEEEPLLLGLEDTWLHYPLPDVEEGYIKKVKALRMVVTAEDSLPALAPSYWPDLTTAAATPPATTQALEQQANERIIKAHYGYAEVAPNTLLYVIPIDLQEVRPKDMDKPHMELGVAPVRANDHYKDDQVDAQAQEKEFLAAVAQRSRADIGLVKTALELIKWYHGPTSRHSGEPFYLHPLAVAQLVLDYSTDVSTLLAALLHDTVEDTMMFLKPIEAVFGAETAGIVDVVTHVQSVEGSLYKVKLSGEENLRMLEMTGNTRGLYVKLADRMHNMRTIEGHRSLAKRQSIAEETLAFFVPLAKRLGLPEAAQELVERSREVLMKGT